MVKNPPTPDTAPDDAAAKSTAAADAAVAEADADEAATVRGTFAGVDFEFPAKRLSSIQFRRLMQRGTDLLALEWLLSVDTFNRMVANEADGDNGTDDVSFTAGLFKAIGEASRAGNSASSSG